MQANREMLNEACRLITHAGIKLKENFGRCDSSCKSNPHDLVTDLDRSTEVYLNTELGRLFPEIGFEGEEFGLARVGSGNSRWLADPIDGTFHFVKGIPHATTMLALLEDGVVTLGVIYNFVTDELFTALRGEGACCNRTPIRVSDQPLHGSCVSVEMRRNRDYAANRELYYRIHDRTMIYHTLNCGYEFGLVASGKLDGRICYQPWGTHLDFAAGSLLVHEAGGVVSNIGKDRQYDVMDLDLLAVTPAIYRDLTEGDQALFPIQPLLFSIDPV